MTVSLTVNGTAVDVADGAMVLDAVNSLGIDLPQLCKDPDQARLGTCRTCLVHIEGQRGAPASCSTRAVEGMEVRTDSAEIERIRNGVLQLTIDMLPDRETEELGELGRLVEANDLKPGRYTPARKIPIRDEVDESNPIWLLDRQRCILCQRCVAACHDVQHIYAISYLGSSQDAEIGFFGGGINQSNCTNCGQCWSVCPTLAIRQRQPLYTQ